MPEEKKQELSDYEILTNKDLLTRVRKLLEVADAEEKKEKEEQLKRDSSLHLI